MSLLWVLAEVEHDFVGWHGDYYGHLPQHGISNEGWGSNGGSDYGTGMYATTDKGFASEHAWGTGGVQGAVDEWIDGHADHPREREWGSLVPVTMDTSQFAHLHDPPDDVRAEAQHRAGPGGRMEDHVVAAAQHLGYPGIHMGDSVVSYRPGEHARIDPSRPTYTHPSQDPDSDWHMGMDDLDHYEETGERKWLG